MKAVLAAVEPQLCLVDLAHGDENRLETYIPR